MGDGEMVGTLLHERECGVMNAMLESYGIIDNLDTVFKVTDAGNFLSVSIFKSTWKLDIQTTRINRVKN